jgi:hypothetical protein
MTRARSFGPAVVAPALRCALSCSAVRAASEDETQQGRFDRLGVLAAGRISCAIFFLLSKTPPNMPELQAEVRQVIQKWLT